MPRSIEKVCIECDGEFKAVMKRAMFCCGKCRVGYWAKRKSDSVLLEALVMNRWSVYECGSVWVVSNGGMGKPVAEGVSYRGALIEAIAVRERVRARTQA